MSDSQTDSVSFSSKQLFFGWVAAIIVVLVATYLLQIGVIQGSGVIILLIVPFLLGLWALMAQARWWMILPVACSFGGMLYFGFKIYTHELALALAIIALVPYITLTTVREAKRPGLPIAIYLLIGYLGIHLSVSEFICRMEGMGGTGNILRSYTHALWPLIFAVLFFKFGSTAHLKQVVLAMYLASLARVALCVVAIAQPSFFLHVPILNFVPTGTYTGGTDLRSAVLLFAALSLGYASISKSALARTFHMAILIPTAYLLLLGGGRASIAAFAGILAIWTLLQRKFLLLAVVGAFLITGVVALNRDPTVLYDANPNVQRALSVLVLKRSSTEVHRGVAGSDRWHSELNRHGLDKWLTSPMTFLFGNRVHRYDESVLRSWVSMSIRVQLAGQMGYYESGLWTILAVTGTVGGLLFLLVFRGLLKTIVPPLISRGVRDHAGIFSFLAVSGIVAWLQLCWTSGHFPSQELMYTAIACAALHDSRSKNVSTPDLDIAPPA